MGSRPPQVTGFRLPWPQTAPMAADLGFHLTVSVA